MDIFSIPEMTLLAATNDFFITSGIEYDPVHLFKDVSVSVPPPTLAVLNAVAHAERHTDPLYLAVTHTGILQLEAQESAELSKNFCNGLLLWEHRTIAAFPLCPDMPGFPIAGHYSLISALIEEKNCNFI